MKKLQFTIILSVLLLTHSIQAQSKRKTPQKLKSQPIKLNKQQRRFSGKIISLGVINGKALNLVKPEYPQTARLMNVRGSVSVSVLIDEEGSVIEAKAVSGHLLLRPKSVSAALQSKFAPVLISDYPVKVRGVIVYRYVSDTFNWLEIGYATENTSFVEMLPFGFEDERQMYEQYQLTDDENRILILQNIRASIESKLVGQRKDFWLFQTGGLLNKIRKHCCGNDSLKKDLTELKNNLLSSPENISSALIAKLQRIVALLDDSQLNIYDPKNSGEIYRQFRETEENLPMLGN